jgi:hypothetical protein
MSDEGADMSATRERDALISEMVEELRAEVHYLRSQLHQELERRSAEAERYQQIAVALAAANASLSERLRELEPPLGTPQEPREAPKAGWLADLVPSPRVPSPRGRTGEAPADEEPPEDKTRLTRLRDKWMRSSLARYLSYAIGIVLTAAATGLDFFYTPGGVDIDVLRLLIAVAFGIYVGIKDGMSRYWGRFNIIGALAGLLAWVVAAYVSEAPLEAAYSTGDIDPVVNTFVTYCLGTWLMFISGFQLGKAVQIRAEEDRGRPHNGSTLSGEPGTRAGGARASAILGVVGVIVAALLQTLGQIVSAFVGNSGP